MKLSLVIPCYTIYSRLETTAYECVASMREQADELIVVEDGGAVSNVLAGLADTYIRTKENQGFTAAVNLGWSLSHGDYVAIVNSDIALKSGSLNDLCIPGRVTSPDVVTDGAGYSHMAGCFFVVPREIRDEHGVLDPSMKMYWSDTDYGKRIDHIYKRVLTVKVDHLGGVTTQASDAVSHSNADHETFSRKWGYL